MKRQRRRAVVCLLALVGLALAGAPLAPGSAAGDTLTLTVLATTDLHGHIFPHDYLEGRAAERGLAKVASYIKQVRARQPHTLLLDCGDTFQGTPLAYLSAEKYSAELNPMVAAMNALGYDAMAPGNHEWDFGLRTLWRLKEEAQFPWLAANVVSTYHDSRRDFPPYVIRRFGGARVAILGMVTPAVPRWNPPSHAVGYEFRDLVETARRYVPALRKKADVVIVIVHAGLGRDPETGARREELYPEEDRVWDIAEQVPGIDLILFGHSHRELEGKQIGAALLVQPRFWGQSVAEVELTLTRDAGRWRVAAKRSRLVPMDASVAPDPQILELTRVAHERTEAYLNTVLGRIDTELGARTGRVEDTPLVELIQRAQLHYGRADVSLAALFSPATRWQAGPLTIRDVYRLYFYDNKLYTVEITGAQLKQALEYSARSFNTYPWPEGGSPFAAGPGYNYNMAEGVSYQIDVSRPPGDRIMNLQFQGAPLAPARKLRLALNSYRWSGGGRYDMLRHAKVVEEAGKEVRELIVDYLLEQKEKKFVPAVDGNWEIVPPEARQALLDSLAPRP